MSQIKNTAVRHANGFLRKNYSSKNFDRLDLVAKYFEIGLEAAFIDPVFKPVSRMLNNPKLLFKDFEIIDKSKIVTVDLEDDICAYYSNIRFSFTLSKLPGLYTLEDKFFMKAEPMFDDLDLLKNLSDYVISDLFTSKNKGDGYIKSIIESSLWDILKPSSFEKQLQTAFLDNPLFFYEMFPHWQPLPDAIAVQSVKTSSWVCDVSLTPNNTNLKIEFVGNFKLKAA